MAVKPLPLRLLPYMWKAWWRKEKGKSIWQGANNNLIILLAFFMLVGITASSVFAFRMLKQGHTAQGLMMMEMGLNSVMMGWLFIPVMTGTTTAEGRGLQPVRLGQYPLGQGQLLTIGLLSHLIQPVYWLLAASSLVAMLPLWQVAQVPAGLAAGALFLIFSALLAWSLELFGSALFSSRHGREMMLLMIFLTTIPVLTLINGEFSLDEGAVIFSLNHHQWLLLNQDATAGLLPRLQVISPATWVSGVADGRHAILGLSLLAFAAGFSALLAGLSLRRVMLHPPASLRGRRSTGRPIGTLPLVAPKLAPLVIKEFRYLTRTLDHLMGLALGWIGFGWVMIKPEHLFLVVPLGVMNIVFNESAIPLNVFGLDRAGVDRYRLLPLTGRQVMLTKNLAYFALVCLHISPLILAGLIRRAFGLTCATVLATIAVTLVTAAWGNRASIHSPAPRAFFNFDSKEQTGGGLALLLAGLLWLVPVAVFLGLRNVSMSAMLASMGLLVVLGFFIYRFQGDPAGRSFEENAQSMRERLVKE